MEPHKDAFSRFCRGKYLSSLSSVFNAKRINTKDKPLVLSINTNISSLNTQRQLTKSQSGLATSFERLSSGLRINSAKDDAAGMAIGARMTAQIRGQNQAYRNVNDGISLAQTAEGALASTGDALQRIRVLAVQSANASNSPADRLAMDAEVQQLVTEMERVQGSTQFNGIPLLDGSYSNQAFQVGANVGDSVSISIPKSLPSMDGDVTTTKVVGTETVTIHHPGSGTKAVYPGASIPWPMTNAGGFFVIRIQGELVSGQITATNAVDGAAQMVGFIRAATIPGLEAVDYTPGTDHFTLRSTVASVLLFGDKEAFGFQANMWNLTEPPSPDTYETRDVVETTTIPGQRPDVTTVAKANSTLAWVDLALEKLDMSRANLGATQNRFTSIANNLSVSSENLEASRSRIMDADFAQESAGLAKNQILQQAGTAMLAQANSLPQNVLSLLPK